MVQNTKHIRDFSIYGFFLTFRECIVSIGIELLFDGVFLLLNVFFYLCAHILESINEKTTATTARVTDILTLLRIKHFHHKIYDSTRRKELPQLATECTTEEFLKGNTFHIVRSGREIVYFQLFYYLLKTILADFDNIVRLKEMVVSEILFCFLKQILVERNSVRNTHFFIQFLV